jgi:hypothetical protein
MKEVEYSWLSRGGPGGVYGFPVVLLTSRGSAPKRSRGSHPSPGRGYGLGMSLKSCGMRQGPMGPH